MDRLEELEAAAAIVRNVFPPTPQIEWPLLNRRAGCRVWLKHENHGPLGAFKARGGLVYFAHLMREQPRLRGVIAATRGNHGQSVAFAARAHGLRAVIVVPHGNSREKNAAMAALGAELIVHGEDFQAALEFASHLSETENLHFVPSMHPRLVLGVASYGLELLRGASGLEAVYAPIGLGSGICGLAAAREALGLRTELVGVVAEGAPAYALSFEARRLISTERADTLADGVACRRPDPTALEVIRANVSRIVRITDEEVCEAMRAVFQDTHNLCEPAGALAVAAILRERDRVAGRRVAAILSGANVDMEVFREVLAGGKP